MFVLGLNHTLKKVNAGYQLGKGQHKKINHFLFMDDLQLYGNSEKDAERLTNTAKIFSKNIAMEFGISKCAHVTMKAGKLVSVGGMELSSGEVIPELELDKGYKYLGILEANEIMHTEMKDKIHKVYHTRVRELISSKLNGGKTIRSINSRVMFLVRLVVEKVKWYNHKPASIVENDRVKILWDFNIQTDHVIQHRRPGIVVLYKTEKKCHLVDIAAPGNKRIELKKKEKIDNYPKLRRDVKKKTATCLKLWLTKL